MVFGLIFLILAVVISNNKAMFPLVIIGGILILASNHITKKSVLENRLFHWRF